MVELPYGRLPYPIEVARFGKRRITVALPTAAPAGPPPPLGALLDAALDAPIGGAIANVRAGDRVTVIVSDHTRDEPRAAFIAAVRARLPGARVTIAIATGTHGPTRDPAALGVPPELPVVNHDGHAERDLVWLGETSRGTPVRVHRVAVEADLVVATGCIRPHYFAGFGAGVKAIFPGLGGATEIRINHRWKTAPGARAGIVDDNPCRRDLEEAVRLLPAPTFLLNGVCAPDGRIHAAVAGDVERAFRAGADLARPWFEVAVEPAALVVASDGLPVTASLYQAAKIAAACAHVVADGGALVVVAECVDGVGPLETVNEAILRTGVMPRLGTGVQMFLVSSLQREVVERTLMRYASSVEEVAMSVAGDMLLIPKASQLVLRV